VFLTKLRFSDKRYEVVLPWTRDPFDVSDHYQMGFKRLVSLQQRPLKEPHLVAEYDQIIHDQMNKCIVERVPEITMSYQQPHNPIHYLPRLPVIQKGRSTSKVRVVYDGSARSSRNNLSLNGCLQKAKLQCLL